MCDRLRMQCTAVLRDEWPELPACQHRICKSLFPIAGLHNCLPQAQARPNSGAPPGGLRSLSNKEYIRKVYIHSKLKYYGGTWVWTSTGPYRSCAARLAIPNPFIVILVWSSLWVLFGNVSLYVDRMGHTDNKGLAWILVTLVWSFLVCFNLVWFRLAWIDFVWSHFVRIGLVWLRFM